MHIENNFLKLLSATECYDAGKPYEGRRICTKTGKMCQDWALQNVYSEGPNFNISESANRCRDPGEVKGEPWCYTTEGGGLWDTCDIPRCSSRYKPINISLFDIKLKKSRKQLDI